MSAPSVRTIAETCGLSNATVSRALAGHPSVRPATREQVATVAKRLGYTRNHLIGTLMSQLRLSRAATFHGNLALIHVPSAGQPLLLPTHRRIIAGARTRAGELGFKLDLHTLGGDGLKIRRLVQILRARNTTGLIFIYADPNTVTTDFPWNEFTSVEIDYGEREPRITTVCIDHFDTVMGALNRLHALGYRRMGMFLERFKDDRLWYRFSSVYHSFHVHTTSATPLPTCVVERMNADSFFAWYRRHKPDLVIGHVDEAVEWLRSAGVRVPETTAFFSLNWTARKRPCAGFDILPELQGIVAVESVIAQVHRHERGLPDHPRTIMIRGRWVDGPTLTRKPLSSPH